MAKAVTSKSVVDASGLLHDLMAEGNPVKRQDGAALSPYLNHHARRFGDYIIYVHVVLALIISSIWFTMVANADPWFQA
jgi:hypothetical protein